MRGEVVIVVAGASPVGDVSDDDVVAALRLELAGGSSKRDAVGKVATELRVRRGRVYDLVLSISK